MPTLNQITRLLEAAEAMTSLLHNHTAELAAGQEPLVFTAADTYMELQEAAGELRHAIELDDAITPKPVIDFDPNLTMCGRFADQRVTLTFGLWEFRASITVTVGGNCTGLTVIESAIARALETLLDEHERYARIVMTNSAGDTLETDDEDDRGEEWLAKMLISAEIISIEPEKKPEAESTAVRESEVPY